jgi:hypothetical protein
MPLPDGRSRHDVLASREEEWEEERA